MKNGILCLALVLGFLAFFACGTQPPAPTPAPAPTTPAAPPPTPGSPPPPPPPPPPERAHDLVLDGAEYYTVVTKDTLSHIARLKYGSHNGYYYPLIIMASAGIVEDQDLIEPGTVLTVPNLQANLNDARAKASMKKFFLEVADITERKHKRPHDAAGLRKLANSW